MRKVEITKIDISSKKALKAIDYVTEEKPLHIFLNRTHYATIYCSPSNLKELTIGHLLSEGIIKTIEEIEETNLTKKSACHVKLKRNVDLNKRLELSKLHFRVILSACGSSRPYQYSERLPRIESNLRVKADMIFECVNRLNFIAETFRKTGGVHAAAIYGADGTIVAFAEDIGRHNAVDKVIGSAALRKTDFSKCFLALTGRLTGDIVYKAAKVGLPLAASLAAAIDTGIAIAKRSNLTLVGFVRGKRMNVYTFPERIML